MSDTLPGPDVIHQPVTVTILDIVTGATRTSSEWSPWWWSQGNGACDCNRGHLFFEPYNPPPCGNRRYYVTKVEGDASGYTLDDYNANYPQRKQDDDAR